ncbi:ABC transporter permease [Oryzobacter telluris]|uniref:ABC transporter permease n=1 Tax=Oryzobacter telluris TaxID=3149179 RepID=UPI00370DBEEF
MIIAVTTHRLRVLQRQRVVAAVGATLLVATALAGVLGWSSHQTIVRVYDEAARLLQSTGRPAPPNPFLLKPTLSALSNMVVYVPLVGALLALVLGHVSLADDESSGLGRLLFSRAVSRTQFALGTVLSVALVLLAVLAASLAVSLVSLLLVNGALSADDLGRLVVFFGLAWLYLLVFGLVGMVTVLLTRSRALALLLAIGVWLVVTFAVPQLTSGLRPVQSLNPVTEPVGTSQLFFEVTARARPLSVVEQFKTASAVVLDTAPTEPVGTTLVRVLPIAALAGLLLLAVLRLVGSHDWSRSASDE